MISGEIKTEVPDPKAVNKYGRGTFVPLTVNIMQNNKEKKEKNWVIKSDNSETALAKVRAISDALGIDPVIARLLYTRGYTDPQSSKSFMYMESEMLCDPFLLRDAEKYLTR